MEFFERLGNIDRRFLYALLFLTILIPLVRPIGLPVTWGRMEENIYRELETIKPGEVVLFSNDFSVGGEPELWPQTLAIARHLLAREARVILIAFVDQGVMFSQRIVDLYLEAGKKYGVDVVNLGFLAGVETAIAAFLPDFARAAPVDFYAAPSATLPLLMEAKSVADIRLIAEFATGKPGPMEWVRQLEMYRVPFVSGMTTSMAPQAYPYVDAGQAVGVMGGMRSAAGYEALTKKPGPATKGMDAQSMAHLLIIVFIIFGNLAFWSERSRQKTRETKGG